MNPSLRHFFVVENLADYFAAVLNAWKRVGKFDLPNQLLWVITGDDGKREVRQIVFRKHRLAGAKTAAK